MSQTLADRKHESSSRLSCVRLPDRPLAPAADSALIFAAIVALVGVIVIEAQELWREWSQLRVEMVSVNRNAVIGYHDISPVVTYAVGPPEWFRREGDQSLFGPDGNRESATSGFGSQRRHRSGTCGQTQDHHDLAARRLSRCRNRGWRGLAAGSARFAGCGPHTARCEMRLPGPSPGKGPGRERHCRGTSVSDRDQFVRLAGEGVFDF